MHNFYSVLKVQTLYIRASMGLLTACIYIKKSEVHSKTLGLKEYIFFPINKNGKHTNLIR